MSRTRGSPTNKMLGIVLRAWRERQEFTLKQAAEVIGLSKSVLSRIENGSPTTSDALTRILIWLHGATRNSPAPPTMKEGGK